MGLPRIYHRLLFMLFACLITGVVLVGCGSDTGTTTSTPTNTPNTTSTQATTSASGPSATTAETSLIQQMTIGAVDLHSIESSL